MQLCRKIGIVFFFRSLQKKGLRMKKELFLLACLTVIHTQLSSHPTPPLPVLATLPLINDLVDLPKLRGKEEEKRGELGKNVCKEEAHFRLPCWERERERERERRSRVCNSCSKQSSCHSKSKWGEAVRVCVMHVVRVCVVCNHCFSAACFPPPCDL